MERAPMSRKPTKYVFVTGGVVSSIGKGLASASVGALLALAAQVYGCTPPLATAVAIPASSLAFSEELSLVTQRWVRVAISRCYCHLYYSTKDEKNPEVVRVFTGCQDGNEAYQFYYTVVPLDDGSFYLFATASKAVPGGKSEGAKVEAQLRDAVFDVMRR